MIKRNQIIIAALVIMVAVAGYLNYLDGNNEDNEISLNEDGEVAAIVQDNSLPVNFSVDREINIESDNNKKNSKNKNSNKNIKTMSNDSDAVFVSNNKNNSLSISNYFVQVKLDRDQTRAKEKEILDEMINNSNISTSKKNDCIDEKIKIQQRMEKESAAESMIESRGFKDVYVRIDNNTVDAVVNKETLSDAEIAQIEDIIKRKTGYSASQIRISTIKK
ncbi:MAG: SpoIIIAH-like family protein [Clostridiales bacterium]|nr:SpoIIIAH-like family protein [Clostridiales bacterium]